MICIPIHSSDRQLHLIGPTFAILTPPVALSETVLAILTPLGRDFGTQVAPSWAPEFEGVC